jgi:hypothetical protein
VSTPPRLSSLPDVQGVRVPPRTLELLRDLVQARLGMHYDDSRVGFLRDRLAPLAVERGFDSLLDYYYLLKYDAAAVDEWPRAIDALSVQETYFWREVDQIRALADVIVPRIVRRAPGQSASGVFRARPEKSRCRSRWRSRRRDGLSGQRLRFTPPMPAQVRWRRHAPAATAAAPSGNYRRR